MNFGEYKSRLQVTKANFYHMILRPAYQNEEFYSIISIQGSHMQSLTACFFSWYAITKESGDNITPMSDQKKTQIRMALSFKTNNN